MRTLNRIEALSPRTNLMPAGIGTHSGHAARPLPHSGEGAGVAALAQTTVCVRLPAHATYWIDDLRGLELVCERGAVWLTVDGDPHDVVLSAGETTTPPSRGRMLLLALEDAVLELRRD